MSFWSANHDWALANGRGSYQSGLVERDIREVRDHFHEVPQNFSLVIGAVISCPQRLQWVKTEQAPTLAIFGLPFDLPAMGSPSAL